MPELPEVQTVVNDLQILVGDTITGFWSLWEKSLKSSNFPISASKLEQQLKNLKIKSVQRLGKYVLFELSQGNALLVHLRMTGQLLLNSKLEIFNLAQESQKITAANPYARHAFQLKSGKILLFADIRKFGTIEYFPKTSINALLILKKISPDPFSRDFSLAYLKKIAAKRKNLPIKDFLLKQDLISGIGNIYASEILFDAKISPLRPAGKISPLELAKIIKSTRKILDKAIRLRGTSVSDYRDSEGKKGSFQNVLRVYKKHGQKCKTCDTIIERKILSQRSTFFCPKCQK